MVNYNLDKHERFILCNCAIYLDRLLATYSVVDAETVSILADVLGPDISGLKNTLKKIMSLQKSEGREEDIEDNLLDPDNESDAICRMLRTAGKKTHKEFIASSRSALEKRIKKLAYSGKSEAEKRLCTLVKMFCLSDEEKTLAAFIYIVTVWQQAETYFVDHLHCQDIFGRRYLKMVLQMTDAELNQALTGTFARIEFFDLDQRRFNLNDNFAIFFQKPFNELLKKSYFSRFSGKTIPLESHLVDPVVTEHIINLLKTKRKAPNHILLYGPPGTGKTSYALGLAQKLGVSAYEIMREERNTASTRRAAILACLNMTNSGDGSLVVIDEADNLLNTRQSWFSRGETQDKGWLNQLLEEPWTRMIWITNNIDDIESSVLRRFAFSVHFREFNRRQRFILWESVLKRHHVRNRFPDEEINKLVARYPVSAAIINMAVAKALETSSARHSAFQDIMKMNLDAHLTLQNNGVKPRTADRIDDNYSIDGLHIEGNLPTIMEQIEAFDRCLREPDNHAVRNFNLLFYGPPGAGKSELARYIANHLDRELMVRRVSDIMSKYLGETEQNINRVFSEAEAMEAVLVIDEADSFLFNREFAVRSWEISQTNEFLTQMERFRGVLICTSNRFADLDSASIRRFNHKVGFRPLKPEGNVIFYKRLLTGLSETPLNSMETDMLEQIHDLTPGDFRIVRDRFAIFEAERISHTMMIDALREEARVKKVQEGKKTFGFMRSRA
jgi:SpoVK/Ycf46/Vps4 family AAA+-type ATPase